MSAYIDAATQDANEVLSGFRSFINDGVSVLEIATLLSAALFLAVIFNALV